MAIGSHKKLGSSTFAEDLISNVELWDWHKRSVYVSFQCVLEHVSLGYLLEHQPKLREKLLTACCSQSLAPYASQLYSQLAQKHLRAEAKLNDGRFLIKEMDVWLKPSLHALRLCSLHQARLLLDYCITKLLKLYGKPAVSFVVTYLHSRRTKEGDIKGSFGHTNNHLITFIMCLRTSQRMGLLQHLAVQDESEDVASKQTIEQQDIKSALVHQNDQIRLDSICLICESWKPTVLISESDIQLLKYCLPYNMNCQCPAFRQQLLRTLKKFLNRLSLNVESLIKKKRPDPKDEAVLLVYKDFKDWLVIFNFDQLFYGASYPRKSVALNLLHFIFSSTATNSDDAEATVKLLSTKHVLLLTGMLKDTYEDNRTLALDILTSAAIKARVKGILGSSFIWDLLHSSLDSGRRSCKPDVCRDAAFNLRFIARICPDPNSNILTMIKYFVACLRDDVKVAERNLRKAVRTGPVHGCLYCLRMLLLDADVGNTKHWAKYRRLLTSCIELCFDVASAVFPVVGSDSPEGCIPAAGDGIQLTDFQQRKYLKLLDRIKANSNSNESEYDDRASSQTVLVTCWRSAKESYLLLQLISSIAPLHSSSTAEDGLLSCQQFLEIGEHLRAQLMETVHRGTFEVAYSAFRNFCPLLWRSKHESLNSRPKQWILSTVADICDPEAARGICVTRRSAGLPFFMQALLGCDKGQVARDCLGHVMTSLLPLVACDVLKRLEANDECVCQIHALNVIRGLMKDAALAEEMQPYLSQCIMVAITGFSCKTWTIRNSSTLLFSSLVTRVFGVKKEKDLEASGKNRLSSHEFFSRMPQLGEFLLEHLKQNVADLTGVCDIKRQASLYPVLLLLSRVYSASSTHQESNDVLASFVPFLIRCGLSPIFKCRVMAATSLTSIVPIGDSPKLLSHLAESLSQNLPPNQTHGTLLQLTKMINTKCSEIYDLSSDWKITLWKVLDLLHEKASLGMRASPCLLTRGAFLDLLIELISTLNKIEGADKIKSNFTVTSFLDQLITNVTHDLKNANSTLLPGHTTLHESFGRLLAFSYIWRGTLHPMQTLLCCGCTEANLASLRVLKKHFKAEIQCGRLEKSESTSQLEEDLVLLLAKQPDVRCVSKIYSILSFIVSPAKYDQVLALTRQLAAKTILASEKLLGAVVTCQAICLKGLLDQNTEELSESTIQWLPEWLQFLTSACSIVRHDACVRLNVAKALRTNATQLLVDPEKRLGTISIEAWRILFTLLVDDDEDVREVASHVVLEISKLSPLSLPDEPMVDLLALETALDCVVTLHSASHPERLNVLLDHVTMMSDNENEPLDDAGGSQLFDKGSTNSFIEPQLLHRLVQKTLVRIQPFLETNDT